MKTLIVYDSFFGNTEQVARAMGSALGEAASVQVVRAGEVGREQLEDAELLLVGSPTRGFRPTKTVVDFVNRIPDRGLQGVKVAAFDTRLSTVDVQSRLLNVLVRFFGYAAEPLAKRLVAKGGSLAAPAAGFLVRDSEGPLKEGELARAAAWARLALRQSG